MSRSVRHHVSPMEAAEIYIAQLEAEGYCVDETIRDYRHKIGMFLDAVRLPAKVADFGPGLLIEWTATMKKRGLRDQSVRSYQGPVWTWCRWLHTKGYIDRDIASEVRLHRVRQEAQRRTADDAAVVRMVVTAATAKENPLRNVALVLTLESTGARRKELLSCQYADLDLAEATLHVPHSKKGRDRVVALGKEARLALMRYVLEERPKDGGKPVEGPLFMQRGGVGMSANAAKLALRSVAKRAGVEKGRGSHDYRRKMAATMLESGVPVDVVAYQGGWATIGMVLQYGAEGMQKRSLNAVREFDKQRKRAAG